MPLFHYTQTEALLGILTKREMWFSDLRYSNDRLEYQFERDTLMAEMRQLKGMPESADVLRGLLMPESYFGVCFTELEDALSQWRGYAPGGFAIEVGVPEFFIPPMNLQTLKMCYGPDGLKEVLVRLERVIEEFVPTSDPYSDHRRLRTLAMYISSLKHGGFAEEREWRFILAPTLHAVGGQWSNLRYRSNANGKIIPYMPVAVSLSALRSVWVGPGPNQESNYRAVTDLFDVAYRGDPSGFRPALKMSATPFD